MNGKEITIRLAHIDCPEKKQPFGNNAKQFLSKLCFGKYVRLSGDLKRDQNKIIIAEIILSNGKNVKKELVKNGLAWHFTKYSKDIIYAKLELIARKKNRIMDRQNPNSSLELEKVIKISLAILLLICLLKMPYGYYQLVRFIAFVGFGYLAFEANKKKDEKTVIVFTALVLLFQPFLKIALGRTIWNIVDVVVAAVLFISVLKNNNKQK